MKELIAALTPLGGAGPTRRRAGARNLLRDAPVVAQVSGSPKLLAIVEPVLGPAAFPVRALFFDKQPGANWGVSWHQDLSIAVTERSETPGFGGWSVKDGVLHVQPPVAVLERMLTVRLHLDDCGADNGPLRVIPGSHRHGRLDDDAVERLVGRGPDVSCAVRAGDVIVMRPLLLHASSPALAPNHRRVLHLEFAAEPLPGGLRWFVDIRTPPPNLSPASTPAA